MNVDAEQSRFLGHVEPGSPESCWRWGGHIGRWGYGSYRLGGATVLAHRAAYTLFAGTIPEGMCVLHQCDNPACVNPAHLFLGTNKDNVDDKLAKGRHPKGEMASRAVLSDMEVLALRQQYARGEFVHDLANERGAPWDSVYFAVTGRTYRHLPGAVTVNPHKGKHCAWKSHRTGRKLTAEVVVEIWNRLSEGVSAATLSAEYRVSRGMIWNIANGRAWTHVTARIADGMTSQDGSQRWSTEVVCNRVQLLDRAKEAAAQGDTARPDLDADDPFDQQ